jgi:hypothetical protein
VKTTNRIHVIELDLRNIDTIIIRLSPGSMLSAMRTATGPVVCRDLFIDVRVGRWLRQTGKVREGREMFTSVNRTKLQQAFALAHKLSQDLNHTLRARGHFRAIAHLIWKAHGEEGGINLEGAAELVRKMESAGLLSRAENATL